MPVSADHYKVYCERLRVDHSAKITASTIKQLEHHYLEVSEVKLSPMQKQQRVFAVLCVMASAKLDDAAALMSSRASVQYSLAEKMILQSLSEAPDSWKDEHQDSLYAKGIIRGAEKFYEAAPDMGKGRDFDRLRQKVPAAYQPVLYVAIDCHSHRRSKYLWYPGTRVMEYTAVQLMEDGPEKTTWLQKFQAEHGPSSHRVSLEASAKGISMIAQDLGISDLPDIIGKPEPKLSKLQAAMSQAADSRTPEEIQAEAEAKVLAMKLKILSSRGAITERQKEVYLDIIKPKADGSLRSDFEVQSLRVKGASPGSAMGVLPLKLDDIREIRKMVPRLLQAIDADPAVNKFIETRVLAR